MAGGSTPPTTPFKSSAESESIINRKRDVKGLPGSFSSNLSRRTSSPRPTRDETTSSNVSSVKAIVAWLEKSKENSICSTLVDTDSKPKTPINTTSPVPPSRPLKQDLQLQSLPMAPGVEEYSLTLLKYRSYFTERPLGRCLDGQDGDQNAPKNQDYRETHI